MSGFLATPSMRDIESLKHHIDVLTWLLAELTWKFQEHRHNGGGEGGTAWGPVLPHWKTGQA